MRKPTPTPVQQTSQFLYHLLKLHLLAIARMQCWCRLTKSLVVTEFLVHIFLLIFFIVNNHSFFYYFLGSSIRNGRPWGPLSRRRPVEEELTENQKASFELPNEVRFADRLLKSSKKIDQYQNHFDVHSVPLVKSDDSRSTFERFSFGNPDQHAEHRAFLVLGSNRLSQAQFINGIVNYIFNVEKNDKFRFQLIKEEEIGAEINCIKVYDVHHANGFRVPFSITIVAVPIYNDDADDSQVLFKFQTTAKMLLEFLEDDGRINKLNMICNLVSDNLYNQSLSILGKDVAGSITDCWEPFNYLDGYCSWHHSLTIQRFFAALTEKNVNSLPLTRQLLKERILLEGKLNTLKSLIEIGCEKMKAIDKAKSTIVFCDSHIESTEDVEENDIQELAKKVWLPTGEYAYNCDRCFFTCNNSFVVGEEKDSTSSAHAVFEGKTLSGFCSICPEKCSLKMHFNQHFRWVKQEMKNNSSQSRPSAENKMRWSDMKSISSDQITMLQNHLKENGTTMLKHFQAAWGCLQHLNKNALHGTSFFTKRLFDILNNAEQQLKELGYQEEIDSLRN